MATDNELFTLLIDQLDDGLDDPTITVVQANQPTMQGAESGPAVYLFKTGDHRYGFPHVASIWDGSAGLLDTQETQVYETTFQVSAMVTQDPAAIDQPTASDLANTCAMILASGAFQVAAAAAGVGVLRITDVRNPYFQNDRDQFQASPSFDVTLTHKRVRLSTTEPADPIEGNVHRV